MNKKTVIFANVILLAVASVMLAAGKYKTTDHFLAAVQKELRGTGIVVEHAQLAGEYSVLVTEDGLADDVQLTADAVNRVIKSGRFEEKKADQVTLCFIHEREQRFNSKRERRFNPEFKLMFKYDNGKGMFTGRYLYEARNLEAYDVHKLFGLPCFSTMESVVGVARFDELSRLSELEELTFYDTDVDISKLTSLKKLKKIYVNSAAATNCDRLAEFPDLELAYLHPTFFDDKEFEKAEKVKAETGKDIRYVH